MVDRIMSPNKPLEQLAVEINHFDRNRCINELCHFDGLQLDFTPEFLGQMSVEKLRHVLMAALITASKRR